MPERIIETLAVETPAAETPAETNETAKASAPISELFTTLPFCRELSGTAQVMKPGASEWIAVEDGRFYPLGSVFKAGADLIDRFPRLGWKLGGVFIVPTDVAAASPDPNYAALALGIRALQKV